MIKGQENKENQSCSSRKKALRWRVKVIVWYESRPVMVSRMDLVANKKEKK